MATASGFFGFSGWILDFPRSGVASMIVDYFLGRRSNLGVSDMYSLARSRRYWYAGGVNWRVFSAPVVGFPLPPLRFVASFCHTIGSAATRMYGLGWVLDFLMGCLSCGATCMMFKGLGDDENYGWEEKVGQSEIEIVDGVHFDERWRVGEDTEKG